MYSPELYKPRVIDRKIEQYLSAFGSIAIIGPRFCGKTTSGQAHCNSEISLADSNNNFTNRDLALASPAAVLPGEQPRLIDEWQIAPQIWDAVRFACDEDSRNGKFILTGSSLASVKSSEIYHSGTGRIAPLQMNSMSLYETGDSVGTVSISSLFEQPVTPLQVKKLSINDIILYCVRGGWPKSIDESVEIAKLIPAQYINKIISDDIYSIPSIKIRKDEKKIRTAIRVLGLSEGTSATFADYTDTLEKISSTSISRSAFNNYIDALKKLFVVYEQPAYDLPAKSGARFYKTSKLRFTDPSLAVAAMNLTPKNLLEDMGTLSRVFDCLCVHDLKIYADSMDGKIYHIIEEHGATADCVIELQDGRIALFRNVLSATNIDKAISSLARIKKILTNVGKTVSVMCVICGLPDAVYTKNTADGDPVVITPLTALAP